MSYASSAFKLLKLLLAGRSIISILSGLKQKIIYIFFYMRELFLYFIILFK